MVESVAQRGRAKESEGKLFDEQMKWQSMFDTTPEDIVVIALNEKIAVINDQARRARKELNSDNNTKG
jgi:hypothetical protein